MFSLPNDKSRLNKLRRLCLYVELDIETITCSFWKQGLTLSSLTVAVEVARLELSMMLAPNQMKSTHFLNLTYQELNKHQLYV